MEASVASLRWLLGLDKPEDKLGWNVIFLNEVIDVPDFKSGAIGHAETGDVAYVFIGDKKLLNMTARINGDETTYTFTLPTGKVK